MWNRRNVSGIWAHSLNAVDPSYPVGMETRVSFRGAKTPRALEFRKIPRDSRYARTSLVNACERDLNVLGNHTQVQMGRVTAQARNENQGGPARPSASMPGPLNPTKKGMGPNLPPQVTPQVFGVAPDVKTGQMIGLFCIKYLW